MLSFAVVSLFYFALVGVGTSTTFSVGSC